MEIKYTTKNKYVDYFNEESQELQDRRADFVKIEDFRPRLPYSGFA